jgi:hypothetical protein
VLALVAVLILFWAAISHRVYNHTLPQALADRIFGEDDADAVRIALRKAYSVVAFALAGFVADRALGPGRRRAVRAAIVVAAFSVLIEVAQKLRHGQEDLAANALDVACGALGGWLGVVVPRAFARLRARGR